MFYNNLNFKTYTKVLLYSYYYWNMKKIKILVIGLGYWGKNFKRIIESFEDRYEIVAYVDKENIDNCEAPQFSNIDDFLDPEIEVDASVVCTPANTHYELTKKLLQNGIHCLVEKPFTLQLDQSRELFALSKKKNLEILVDHTFLYDSTIQYIQKIVENGAIGDLIHISFERSNLGPIRTDVNSSWDLSTHDISILLALVNEMPLDISSEGFSIIGTGVEDVVNTSLTYEKLFVTLFASWLHPEKTRKIKIVGSKKMIVWDGMLFGEEVKIFDKGYEINNNQDSYTNLTQIRNGDIVVPNIQKSEPLKEVVLDFYNKILGEDINRLNTEQLTNNVVEIMEKINLK